MILDSVKQSRSRKWILLLLFWTVMAVFCATQLYVSQALMSKPVAWSVALRRSFEEYYLWAALSVIVIHLARRFSLETRTLRHWILVHIAGALATACVFSLGRAALLHGQRSVEGYDFQFSVVLQKLLLYYTHQNVMIYWALILAYTGYHYYQRYRQREREAAELQTQLVEARLEALRMQLNPHFLFNTLHTISSLIHSNPEAADRTVARLSELLRTSLDHADTQEIPLRQELGFLERYLEIEQTRFQDRLTVEMKIDGDVQEALVPCLILQPLVENAIRHGIEPREDMGRVEICARRKDGQLELKVSDNGPGLPQAETSAARREGIGLSNTRSRLQHLYGAKQQIDLTTGPEGGLEVRLVIPFHTSSQRTVESAAEPVAECVFKRVPETSASSRTIAPSISA